MPEITLVKQSNSTLNESELSVVRKFLFEMISGISDDDTKSWNRFWKQLSRAGSGEIFSIDTWIPRCGPFHKMHMKMEVDVFKAQERIKDFNQFRLWLKVGSGFVDWMAGPRGGVVPIPKSISYKKCDEATMRKFHEDSVDFLRTEHAHHYLWPRLTPQQSEAAMERILSSRAA